MSEIKKIDAGGLHLTVRYLKLEDLGQLIALTSSVSWQLTLEDLKMMHKADNKGFVGAFLDDGTLICKKCFTLVIIINDTDYKQINIKWYLNRLCLSLLELFRCMILLLQVTSA